MYELSAEQMAMKNVFGIDTNILRRNGMESIQDVKDYIEQYPFDEYKKYRAWYYRGIGLARYIRIVETLRKHLEEES